MPSNGSSSRPFRVRLAVEGDADSILRLIRGLAEYEKAPEEVLNTVEQLKEDGWGATPRFTAFVAEVPDTPSTATSTSPSSSSWHCVAFALTYFAYSTWKGNCLYLEDIYVEPDWRAHGIGMSLIRQCVEFAHSNRCQRVMWQALDWNTPAIQFYVDKMGATIMKEWLSLRLTSDGIEAFRRRYNTGEADEGEADNNSSVQQPQQQQQQQQEQQRVSEADMSTLS